MTISPKRPPDYRELAYQINKRNFTVDNQAKGLITWAARMVREQDEICRGSIGGYDSFSQEEIKNLKALEALGKGVELEVIDYHTIFTGLINAVTIIKLQIKEHRGDRALGMLEDTLTALEELKARS